MQTLRPTFVIILLTAFLSQEQCARIVEHIGSNSITKFSIQPGRESTAVLSPIQVLPGVPSAAHCSISCARHRNCLSFNFKSAVQTCELFDDIDPDPNEAIGVTYEVVKNRKGISSSVDCLETWTPWSFIALLDMWDYCGVSPSSQMQCTDACTENSTRESMDPPAYGGAVCYPNNTRQRTAPICTNQTTGLEHILLVGGFNSDIGAEIGTVLNFIPETKQVIMLKQQLVQVRVQPSALLYNDQIIVDGGNTVGDSGVRLASTELLTGVPLRQESLPPYIPHVHFAGCTVIWNDNYYNCFGEDITGFLSHCDVYDLTNNYAHSSLPTQLPALTYVTCIQADQYLYVLGGYTGANSNQFYQMDLTDGTKTDLIPFHIAAHMVGIVWFGGNIVACGGKGDGVGFMSTCKEYTFGGGWIPFPPMTVARGYFELVNFGPDKLLAIGGYPDIATIEMYDRAVGSWTHYADLPHPLRATASVVFNG